jgi:DNA-binding NtrC family response regulator
MRPAILIVDNDRHYLSMVRMFLENCGYAVQCAACAEAALGLCADFRFAVVVTDLRIADDCDVDDCGGISLLKAIGTGCDAPRVIVHSGYLTWDFVRSAHAAGAVDFVGKSDGVERLLLSIRKALGEAPDRNSK